MIHYNREKNELLRYVFGEIRMFNNRETDGLSDNWQLAEAFDLPVERVLSSLMGLGETLSRYRNLVLCSQRLGNSAEFN